MNGQKMYFQLMDRFLPGLAAKQVYQVMSNPRVRKLRDFEDTILDKSIKEKVRFKGFDIQTYSWGEEGSKQVFLIHGWEGQAGNFGALVELLLGKGYHIRAFDGPSHGYSSSGSTNMFEFAELVSTLLKTYRPSIVISHSFGSVTSMLALSEHQDLPIEKWLAVTTPHNFKTRLKDVSDFLGVTQRTMDKVISLIERETDLTVDLLNMAHYADKIDHVKDILIVHSKIDRILSIESARIVHQHLAQSRLIELDNLGHYSILWSDELKEIVKKEL